MKLIFTYLLLFVLISSCGNQGKKSNPTKAVESEKVWQITFEAEIAKDKGLLHVESILYDETNQVFYTSNGKDYKPGTDGFISKLSNSGQMEELKWISNLSRPTGMALKDSVLYVADVNALVAINTKDGSIIAIYEEPIAKSGLNDVTINSKGEVYVSASFNHAVFKLTDNGLEQWAKDDEKLQWANGLFASDDNVIVGGMNLCSISIASKEIELLEYNPKIKDFDGIVADGLGGYFLTTVENSGLYYLNPKGETTKLMEEEAYFGDLELVPGQKKIYIPRGNHKTNDYFISVLTVEQSSLAETNQK